MEERLQLHVGGIFGLLDLIDRHGEALEYDLIGMGFRLDQVGSAHLSWHDLWVIARGLPRESATVRAIRGEAADWTPDTGLLANVVDLLAIANWQRAGRKSAARPKRVPRPGQDERQHIGKDPLPINEMDEWIAKMEAGEGD